MSSNMQPVSGGAVKRMILAFINGKIGKDGRDGMNGRDGLDGYTPLRGTDYWTPEDVAAMESDNKAYIIEELAKRNQQKIPVVNSTSEMTDTDLLYLMVKDGALWYYAYTKVYKPAKPLFTNVLPTAIDTDGSIYNGIGYKDGWRTNSSGGFTGESGCTVTGYIWATNGQDVYMRGIPYHTSRSQAMGYDKSFVRSGNTVYGGDWTKLDNGDYTFTVDLGAASEGYFNVVGKTPFADDAIISVGKPIAYSDPEEVQEWTPVQPLVYTDHTADIQELQGIAEDHDKKINNLLAGNTDAVDMRTWDKPVYDTSPVVLIGDDTDPTKAKPAVGARNTVQAIYDAYDGLMADHPRYITRTPYKDNTVDGQILYRYDFNAPRPHMNSDGRHPDTVVKPKIILISGIHYEMVGIWSLFHALEEIATNPALRDIKRNAHLIVVPVCNPYCISGPYTATNHRKNANGVEIHRNFAVDHVVIDSTSDNYGGAEPLSEIETQHIDSILAANPDAVAFVSCHNFDGRNASQPFGTSGGGVDYGTTFTWASTATDYLYNLGGRFGVKMSEAWEDKYGDAWRNQIDAIVAARKQYNKDNEDTVGFEPLTYQPEGDYTVGMAGKSTTPGTEAKHCMLYGIQGMTFEVAGNMMALDSDNADSTTITRGAEVYANLIATLLAAYDRRDKKEYAPVTVE